MVRYSDETRKIVADLKYHRQKSLALEIAYVMAELVDALSPPDVLAWIPTTDHHRALRGFDHAELITRHLGALVSIPARRVLRRITKEHQTGKSRKMRLENVSFVASPNVAGQNVWAIDDVWTTGSTFRHAACALLGAGASSVVCVAYAHVP